MTNAAAELPNRKSTRLPAYDYGQTGGYFVTVCTEGRRNTLASIRRGDPTLGRIVGAYKSIVYQRWRQLCGERGCTAAKIWQRNYYEHVARNDQDSEEIRKYIDENPAKWTEDKLYCE